MKKKICLVFVLFVIVCRIQSQTTVLPYPDSATIAAGVYYPSPIPYALPTCSDTINCGENLICNGEFENVDNPRDYAGFIPQWDSTRTTALENSLDFYYRSGGNIVAEQWPFSSASKIVLVGGFPLNSMAGPCLVTPSSIAAPQGNGFMGMMGYMKRPPSQFPSSYAESAKLILRKPLVAGKNYVLKFYARVPVKYSTSCPDINLEIRGSTMQPCLFSTPKQRTPLWKPSASWNSPCGYEYSQLLSSPMITNDTSWILITIPFTANANIQYLILSIPQTDSNCNGCNPYGYFDDFRIYDNDTLKITSKKITPCKTSGRIEITPQGGTPPYRFTWNDGDTARNKQVASSGKYYVTVSDDFNCTVRDSAIMVLDSNNSDNISIVKSISKRYPSIGETVTFTIKVCNHAANPLDTFRIFDTLPSGLSLVNANGFTQIGNVLTRTDNIGASPNCKTYSYTVAVNTTDPLENCATVKAANNVCIFDRDCIQVNHYLEACLHKVKKFISPFNPYSIATSPHYQILSHSNDTFSLKFQTQGVHNVVVYQGTNYDTTAVRVIVPKPYISITQNLICNSDFPPNGEGQGVTISEGKCQQVCENSCVWYYAGSYSKYKNKTFKWKIQGATNISSTATPVGDSIYICWGSVAGTIKLIEETADSCVDTATACVQIIKEVGTTDFGVLPNMQDNVYYLCDNQEVTFKDTSTIRNAPELESWCWDMGDGNIYCGDVTLDGLPAEVFDYPYTRTGTFQVKLSYITKCGCVSTKTKTIHISSGTKMSIYCKNPVCHGDTVEYYTDSVCPPPYTWSVTNGTILGSNMDYKVNIIWGDPSDGIGTITLEAPPGCAVCNPIQTMKINILPTQPKIVYPVRACAGEEVTHTSIQMSSTKYVWRSFTNPSAAFDSIYYHNYIVPSSSAAMSNYAGYNHRMYLYNKYNELKCSNSIDYSTLIKDTFHWVGSDTACINSGTLYSMSPAVKSADTIEITGDSLSSPIYFYNTSSLSVDFPTSGTYYIRAKDSLLCEKGNCVKTVYVLPALAKPEMITGKTTVCPNQIEMYSATTKREGIKFNWIVPAGDSIMNASNDYAQIKFKSGGMKRIGVYNSYIMPPYCSSDTTWLDVASAVMTASLIGNTTVCANDTSRFTISDKTGYNYQWRLIPATGYGSLANASSDTCRIVWNNISTNTNVLIRCEYSLCGLDTFAQDTVTIQAIPTPTILGKDTVCIGQNYTYMSGTASNSTPPYYLWTCSAYRINNNNQGQNMTFHFPRSGSYKVNLTTKVGGCNIKKMVSKEVLVLPPPATHVTLFPYCRKVNGEPDTINGIIAVIGNGRYKITNPFGVDSAKFNGIVTASPWSGDYLIYDSITQCNFIVPVSLENCNIGDPVDSTGSGGCLFYPGDSIKLTITGSCPLSYSIQDFGGPYISYGARIVGGASQIGKSGQINLKGINPGYYKLSGSARPLSGGCDVLYDTTIAVQLKADMDASIICETAQRKIKLRDKSSYIEPYYINSRNWKIKKGATTVATGTGATYTSPALSVGTYIVMLDVANDSGCHAYDTQTVTIDSLYVAFTVDKSEICDQGHIKLTPTHPDSSKVAVYKWVFGDSTELIRKEGMKQYFYTVVNGIDKYYPKLEITDYNGCSYSSSTNQIDVYDNPFSNPANKPTLTLSANTICTNQLPIYATANSLPPARTPYLYQWSHQNEFSNHTAAIYQSGTYQLRVLDKYGCEGKSAVFSVGVNQSPKLEMVGKDKICLGNNLNLNYDAGNATIDIEPKTGVSGNVVSYKPTMAGSHTFTAIATNANGCTDTLLTPVTVYPKPILIMSQTLKTCKPYVVEIKGIGNNPRSPLSTAYLWTHGPNTSTTNVRQGGKYTLKFIDTNQCSAFDSISVAKALRFLNFPEGCFEVCQDTSTARPLSFNLSFDRPAYDSWAWYRNDTAIVSGFATQPTNPWKVFYGTAGSFKYHLRLSDKGCSINSPPLYIVVYPQPCIPKKMAYNTNSTNPRIYPTIEPYPVWSLYPSPARDRLYIQSNFSLADKEIWIYATTGKLVYRGIADKLPIKLANFANGVYLAQLRQYGQIISKQTFIVERE